MSLEWLGSNISSFVTFPSSICRAQLAVEVSLESVGLRCWGVSFWFVILRVGWVVGEVRFPFVMNSWRLFCCTTFFRFFLVIPDGSNLYNQVHLNVMLVSQVKTNKCCYQDKHLIALRAMWTDIVFFDSHSIQPIFLFFVSLFFVCLFVFLNFIPSTRVKHKIIMMLIIIMINVNDNKR